jgi:hypothetical protein
MKLIAAYLLAHLGGKPSPTAEDIKNILESGMSSLFMLVQIAFTRHCFHHLSWFGIIYSMIIDLLLYIVAEHD